MEVENSSDELWVGVKGQSRSGIAGSPRKIFRYRLVKFSVGGRALDGLGSLPGYQTQPNFECRLPNHGSQSMGDKFHSREGNNPDRQLRSQNMS